MLHDLRHDFSFQDQPVVLLSGSSLHLLQLFLETHLQKVIVNFAMDMVLLGEQK